MMRVLLRGPFLTNSGYGVHARQLARWALSRPGWDVKFLVLPWGITPWLVDRELEDGLVGRIMDRTNVSKGERFDLSFQVQLPNEWDASLAGCNVGVTAAVETDRCNPEWVAHCNLMDAVIVPSEHARLSLSRTGGPNLRTRVLVVPESFHDEMAQEVAPLDLQLSTDFNFLVFGQLTGNNPENDRKNLFYTLKWLFEEFSECPDVGVVLKTNSGRTTRIDRLITEKFVTQIVEQARRGPYPRVHFLHGKMTNVEVSGLMRHPRMKALVSLTRGEGYGLPILEAAAVGLPVIATGWSGYTDFLRPDDYISVEYDLVPIDSSRVDGKIFMEGARWAHPREADAKKKLRRFYQKPSMPRHGAQRVAKRVKAELCFESIAQKYDDALEEILRGAGR